MGLHSVTFESTTAANACMGAILSDGEVMPEICDIRVGFAGNVTPDDERYNFGVYEISDAGVGGSPVATKKIGPTSPTVCSASKGFATQPTKVGAKMMALNPHRRASEVEKRAEGEGFKPTALAANRGIGIFCDTAPGSIGVVITAIWKE